MKIKTTDTKTNKPVSNTKIQLQVKGKDSGYLSATTDNSGYFELDTKYSGQQITAMNNGTPGQWITANNNATLTVTTSTQTTGDRSKEPAGTTYNK